MPETYTAMNETALLTWIDAHRHTWFSALEPAQALNFDPLDTAKTLKDLLRPYPRPAPMQHQVWYTRLATAMKLEADGSWRYHDFESMTPDDYRQVAVAYFESALGTTNAAEAIGLTERAMVASAQMLRLLGGTPPSVVNAINSVWKEEP